MGRKHSVMAVSLVWVCVLTVPAETIPNMEGMLLWLDAGDTATLYQEAGLTSPVTGDGQSVAGWQDKSGNGHHATTTGTAPTYDSAGIGGEGTVSFSASPLNVTGDLGIGSGAPRTAFSVLEYSSLANNNEVYGTSTGSMVDVGSWTASERLRVRNGSANAFSDAGTVPVGTNILMFQSIPVQTLALNNGVPILDEASAVFDWAMTTNVMVGGTNFPTDSQLRNFDGRIAEVLIYDRALSGAEVNDVNTYLGLKYLTDIALIPEPGSALLVGLWCLFFGLRRRRRATRG